VNAKAAHVLDAWMTKRKIDGDFTACDTSLLNRFFRDYHDAHTRGGTSTKQRNLRHLFTWLEANYDHPHPYTDDLNRYAPRPGGRPPCRQTSSRTSSRSPAAGTERRSPTLLRSTSPPACARIRALASRPAAPGRRAASVRTWAGPLVSWLPQQVFAVLV
jgi:hypothetical protein